MEDILGSRYHSIFFQEAVLARSMFFFFRDVKGRRSGPSRVVVYLNVFGLISSGLLSRSSRAWTRSVFFFRPFCRSINLFLCSNRLRVRECSKRTILTSLFIPNNKKKTHKQLMLHLANKWFLFFFPVFPTELRAQRCETSVVMWCQTFARWKD